MRKVSSYKCPECGMSYKTLSGWGDHVRRLHPDIVPKGWSDARFFYYTLTGKSEGSCIQCHRPTEWNEATGKYSRYCDDPKCKQEYCKMAKQRMIDKYGKPHLLDDPDKQREMLKAKKNSGEYKFSTGGKVSYVCSYERDFLMTCDIVLGLKATDIISPSPHNYVYMYEGKPHIYIPDFYIPDFNLEIEVKDGGDNPNMHHKIQEVDKVKEKLKDQVMIANPSVNYFKVVNKKYDDFYDFILNCKNAIDDDKLKQVQSKITAIQQPAVEGIGSLYEARKDAMKMADRFTYDFDSIAGPMLTRELEIAFSKYKYYNQLTHAYSYPYMYYRRTGKFIDPAYKNTESLIVEIPLMVVNTQVPIKFKNDLSFDQTRIIDVLNNFERNISSTIKLRGVYSKYPNVSTPYVRWDGSDWMLTVTMNYSMDPANESINKSKIDDDFESNGHMRLSSFRCTKLTHELRKRYESESKMLKHAWEADETHDSRIWLDDDKMVAHVCVYTANENDPNRDGYNWISSLEVSPEYRGYGLGKQLLDFAVNTMGGTALAVYKDNEIAIKMYKDKGFKFLDKDTIHKMYPAYHNNAVGLMVLGNPANESIAMESTFISYKDEYFNIDQWKRSVGHNILYVTGLSGSGKSTISHELINKYDAVYIELDRLKGDCWTYDERYNPNGYQNDATAVLKEILKDEDPYEKLENKADKANSRNRRYAKVYEYCTKHPDQLFIIEGIQLYLNFDKNFFIDKPMIIKNTSMKTSFRRMTLREQNVYSDDQYDTMKAAYKYSEHELESLRKIMRAKAVKSPALETVAMESAHSLDWIIERRMTTNDFREIPDSSDLHLTRDAYFERLKKNPSSLRNTEYYGFYYRKVNELVGILTITSDGVSKCIDLLVVDEPYRKHGIGTQMLDSAVLNHGASWLVVKTTNGPAISIYEKYGFKIVDTYHGKTSMVHRMEYSTAATEGLAIDNMKSMIARSGLKLLALPDAVAKLRSKGKDIDADEAIKNIERSNRNTIAEFAKVLPHLFNDIKKVCYATIKKYDFPEKIIQFFEFSARGLYGQKDLIEFEHTSGNKMIPQLFYCLFWFSYGEAYPNDTTSDAYKRAAICKKELIQECNKVYREYERKYNRLSHHVDEVEPARLSVSTYILWKLDGELDKATLDSNNDDDEKQRMQDIINDKSTVITNKLKSLMNLYAKYHDMNPDYIEMSPALTVYYTSKRHEYSVLLLSTRCTDKKKKAEIHKYFTNICKEFSSFFDTIKFDSSVDVYLNTVSRNNDDYFDIRIKSKSISANESAGSDTSYYGLPEDKKYPMDDPKHVLLAIKFFNYVDEDKEELLASRINARIKEFGIHNINVSEKNRFAKYYAPVEEEVIVDWAPNVPYMTVANEGADPSVQLLDDGFAFAPIKLDNDLYEKYRGTDYYPLYIILMKNISPLGSVIRAYTKEEYSHSAISFDASMDDVYTFGNSVIKKPLGRQKSFGAAHESFRKNSFKFSYSGKTEYSLYVMFFKKDEIDRIKKKVDDIFLHHDEYKYNVEGLISYVFNKPKTDPKKLFCSQFVALIVNAGRNGVINKDPSLYSPVGLTTIRGICHVETGHIEDYDQYRAEKKTHAVFNSLIENKAYEALEHANIMYNA